MVTLGMVNSLAVDAARGQEPGGGTTATSTVRPTLTDEHSSATNALQDRTVSNGQQPSPAQDLAGGGRFTAKVQRYAVRLMSRYDLNGDRLLEQSEWTAMRGDPAGTMDLDGDGVITTDEIVTRVGMYGRRSLRVVPNVPIRIAESSDETAEPEPPARMAYRVLPDGEATDPSSSTPELRMIRRFFVIPSQLPQGVAGWFLDNDADGDGQVTMAEFSANWTDVEAKRFGSYDLNSDGVITASECAQAEAERLANEAAEAAASGGAAESNKGARSKASG
jgi:Ca2+-binding EF-hand superfamily protein